jgi:hypothetical protein
VELVRTLMLEGGATERDRKDIVRLGARLANSEDFRVVALDGREIGVLENVRYEKHTDHPDDILIRRRYLLWDRYATVGFDDVANVDPERERVYLTIPSNSVEWRRGNS